MNGIPCPARGAGRSTVMAKGVLPRCGRTLSGLLVLSMAAGALSAPATTAASAAGTVVFNQPFHNNTANGTGAVVLPSLPSGSSGSNYACLTASGNSGTGVLQSCSGNTDSQGSGKLRLTNATTTKTGGLFGAVSVPASQGLDVTFNTYQYGGGGADGITFVLAAVDPANPKSPANIGQSGGALGYSGTGSIVGLAYGYLGIGLDVYGNFSSSTYQGSGCANLPGTGVRVPGQVVIRGPGNGTVGYCALNTTAASTSATPLALRATSRTAVPVQIGINPTAVSLTTAAGLVVPPSSYVVVVTLVGGTNKTLTGSLPTVPTGLYPAGWLNANGTPRQLAFGWVASTGSVTDFHEVDAATVTTVSSVPQLTVAQTGYSATTPAPGTPVTYSVVSGVSADGIAESSPISMTQTMPAGVVPTGAYGTGWVCAAPVGQSVTCTNGNVPFAAGATLPPITVTGVVTGTGVTQALIQTATVVTASSIDANPAYSTTTTQGTPPSAPSGVSLSSTTGSISGGSSNIVSGTNISNATAIMIGTAAEQAAGTAVVLLPCASGATTGCFTANANGTLTIPAMPARAASASVSVTVVTLGLAASATYVYAASPAAPAAPTATAGVSSATVTWTAPNNNGGAITGYLVTPYKNGVAQTPVAYDASTTTRTLSGLTTAVPYTFTVTATNAFGTGTASPASGAVTPYAVPGRPAITSATAGTSSVSLTWTAPATNGSDITGYLVTPYIGGVAQPSQTFNGNATTQAVTGLTPGTSYRFTVAAVNAAGSGTPSDSSATVVPNSAPAFTFAAPPAGEVNVSYSVPLTVSGGTAPYTWSVSAGGLPPGLTLNAFTGVLSGTPTAGGAYSFSVKTLDALNQGDTRTVSLTIAALPAFTFPAPPAGQVGVSYSVPLTVSGGVTPYTWSVSAGSLPPGLTLNASTGVLSGTPTTTGSSPVTFRVVDAAGLAATQSATLVMVAGPLVMVKTANASSVVPGDTLTYTITVNNTGSSAFNGATLTDPLAGVLDDATYNGDASANIGSVSVTGQSLTWTGNVPAGATVTIGYSVTVSNPGTGNKVLANAVTSSTVGSTCPSGGGDPRCSATVTVSGLSIAKVASVATTTPGGTIGYTVTVTNNGQTPYTGATFVDSMAGLLDDAVYNADATASGGSVSYTGPNLTWTGNLAPGASANITYSATVRNPDGGDRTVSNTITSGTPGSTCPAGNRAAPCTATVTVLVPGLTISSGADVATTTPGSVVNYTLTAANTGQTPYAGTGFTASLAGVLDDATVNGSLSATSGTVVDNLDGTFTWTGNLAIGASVTITGSVTVNDPDTGDRLLRTAVTSAAPGNNCPAGNQAPGCFSTVTVLIPGLTIVKSAGTSITTPGSVVNYTVAVTNTGQTAYTGATFADALGGVLDDATYNADAAATSGSVGFAGSALTWTGNLAVGASATITYSVTVDDPDTGNRTLTGTLTSATAGSNCPAGGGDPRCAGSVTVLVPRLTINTGAGVATTTPGGVVNYTTTLANTGQTPYTGISAVFDVSAAFDDVTYGGDLTASSGSVGISPGGSITWSGDIAIGATVTITGSVTVNDPDTGDRILRGAVTSAAPGSTCPVVGASAPGCFTLVTVLVPALTITNTADTRTTTPGGTVTYTTTVTNTGQSPYSGAQVTGQLAQVFNDAVYNGDATATTGTVAFAGSDLTWTGDLAIGASATVTYSVTVRNPDRGDKVMTNTAVSSAPGSTCPAGSAGTGCVSVVTVLVPRLTIAASADTGTTTPGATVGYTVTVTNSGETPYTGAAVTDLLTGVLDDATYNADAGATTGTVTLAGSDLGWTGDLAVGTSATITYSVTVNDPGTGDALLSSTAVSPTTGSNCPTGGTDSRCTVVVAVARLVISQGYVGSSATPGSTIRLNATFTNTGKVPYTGISVSSPTTGTVDDAVPNGDQTASSGTLVLGATAITWTGNIPVGGTVTVTGTVISAAAGTTCPAVGGDPRCTTTVAVLTPGLTITKTADNSGAVAVKATVQYTITVTNTGETPYAAAVVTDSLAGVLDDAVYNNDASASSGTVSYAGGVLGWTGALPMEASAVITFTVVTDEEVTGDGTLDNRVTSATTGGNCPVGGTDPRCSVVITLIPTSITLTDLTGSFVLAGTPDSTVRSNGAVTMTVITNSFDGYSVTVQADSAELTSDRPGNDATIPIGNLRVRESGTSAFQDVSATTPVLVHRQDGPSAPGGDAIGNDFEGYIPFVPVGGYSATLTYVATAS
ncbi:fibronectin type III domain-containing protein [Streptosporangium amethystogenes subsp. fukuiense]|uniref:Fibronectin type III domain-containing protein n=1 Tax=Streptosporangium amethystogenes subsp. fukuiense TaxID=698418 RepID=A0ABW2T7I9_9ACTN